MKLKTANKRINESYFHGVVLPEEGAGMIKPRNIAVEEQFERDFANAQAAKDPFVVYEGKHPPVMNPKGETTTDDPAKIGTGAIKYDAGKPSIWRGVINYFPRALWAVGGISTFGAAKYAWAGWENVEEGFARYKDAQFRHALKQAMGEESDSDSHLDHLAHEAWGALATLELYLRDKEQREAWGDSTESIA